MGSVATQPQPNYENMQILAQLSPQEQEALRLLAAQPYADEFKAYNDAKANYRDMVAQNRADPLYGTLQGTGNDNYIAIKTAGDELADLESAYYRALRQSEDDPWRFNPRMNDETAYFTDAEGNFGLGMKPENMYYNDYSGTMVEGTPGWSGSPSDGLSLGGPGPAPSTPPQQGQDPFSPPPNYDPGGGTGQPNGGIPSWYLPGSGGITNDNLGQGGGAVNGPAGMDPFDMSAFQPPKIGWEQSYNKDFYQDQFQGLRTQQNAAGAQRLAAALRAQQQQNQPAPEPFGGDPWSWANLPGITVGGGQQTSGEPSWSLNQSYGITPGMTNQQVVGAMGQLLTPQEAAIMAEHFRGAPEIASGTRWSTVGDPTILLRDMGSDSNLSPEFANVLQKVFNNTYVRQGGPTGMNIPEGYAAPVNTAVGG